MAAGEANAGAVLDTLLQSLHRLLRTSLDYCRVTPPQAGKDNPRRHTTLEAASTKGP